MFTWRVNIIFATFVCIVHNVYYFCILIENRNMSSSFFRTLRGLLAAAFLMAAFAVQAQKGESCFGVQTGYTSTNNSAIAGLFYQYGFSNHFRVAGEAGCVFRHENEDAFTVDLNFHVPMRITESNVQLYPLVGLNYSLWNHHHPDKPDAGFDDVSTRHSRLGANIGAGFQLAASAALRLKIEAKYTLMSRYSTFVLGVGIGYVF